MRSWRHPAGARFSRQELDADRPKPQLQLAALAVVADALDEEVENARLFMAAQRLPYRHEHPERRRDLGAREHLPLRGRQQLADLGQPSLNLRRTLVQL